MVVVATVVACSSSTKPVVSPTTPVSTGAAATRSAASSSTQPSSQQGGSGHPVNVCVTLPPATVASLTGLPITQAKEDDVGGHNYTCDYTSSDGTSGCTVSVTPSQGDLAYKFLLDADNSVSIAHVQQISGLGDKAFSAVDGVHALFGKVLIDVEGLNSDSAAENLIRNLQPKL